ncbi:hypothetical protein [Sphingobium mellinum]|uniref:hypothetical protein n=1 Tax=Sphingobium mellinum TaxID=1387166 RepID=UPI0030EC8937
MDDVAWQPVVRRAAANCAGSEAAFRDVDQPFERQFNMPMDQYASDQARGERCHQGKRITLARGNYAQESNDHENIRQVKGVGGVGSRTRGRIFFNDRSSESEDDRHSAAGMVVERMRSPTKFITESKTGPGRLRDRAPFSFDPERDQAL